MALDATPLLGARTGIGWTVDGFLRHLAGRPDVRVTGYGLTGRGWRRLGRELPTGIHRFSRPAPSGVLLRAWSRSDWPPGRWWTGPSRVVHGTNFVVPPDRRAARIVSVWDMTAVRYPELCSATSLLYPDLVARALAGGAWVHTGARSVADEIAEYFKVEPERIRVVAPAMDPPSGSGPGRGAAQGVPPYILGIGRTEPRKDFPGLITAFNRLAGRLPELQLHIAGPPGWAEEQVRSAIEASPYKDRIRRLGWVAAADADVILAGAAVLAYPSVYEGFGLPPLEAMAVGVPVVATRSGAIPEVVGDAAELVAPGDPDALAEALEAVVTDVARADRLIAAGRQRVARFSGTRAAEGLISAYRDVAAAQ